MWENSSRFFYKGSVFFNLPNLFLIFFLKTLNKSVFVLVLTNLTLPDSQVPDKTSLIIHSFLIVYLVDRMRIELTTETLQVFLAKALEHASP